MGQNRLEEMVSWFAVINESLYYLISRLSICILSFLYLNPVGLHITLDATVFISQPFLLRYTIFKDHVSLGDCIL